MIRLRSVLLEPFQQSRSWFVVWILRGEFAAEGARKERGRELIDVCLGFRVARFNLAGQREQRVHPAHDFLLFG